MKRRAFLSALGVCTLAGCSGAISSVSGPEYEAGNKDALLPDSVGSEWTDQNLEPRHDFNENFDRVWITEAKDLVVMMDVQIAESVSGAEEQFEQTRATASDPRDYPMADEAFISDDGEAARCAFRHSNALGLCLAMRLSGAEWRPDRQRAGSYAEHLFAEWQ